MDPVVAFGLAGTILQLIDSGTKFGKLAWALYKSGPDDSNAYSDLLTITGNLNGILPKLNSTESEGDSEKSLSQLARDCGKTATRLLAILQKISTAENGRKRGALKAAFRLICKEDEIKSLQNILITYQSQLSLHLLLSLREHASKSVEQQQATHQALGIIQKQTLGFHGIFASVLESLAPKGSSWHDPGGPLWYLRSRLLRRIAEEDRFITPHIQLSRAGRDEVQSAFFAQLQYDGMIDRERRIATAHEATFQWVLQDNKSQNPQAQVVRWSSFRDWLESDDQLYWITGKAGSGKSTLMKFLCSPTDEILHTDDAEEHADYGTARDQSRCRPYLKKWAGTSGLVVACFYFWNSGMELQVTQTGLLRSLLYEVVAQRPDIIPLIAPKQWECLCLLGPNFSIPFNFLDMLFKALKILGIDSKICVFIDGLDEFDGSHEILISMVKQLIGGYKHVKICVASRPWNVFQTAFGQRANLRLEDLTFDDIKNFIQSKFQADREFENLRIRYPSFADQLIHNIVVKASGVFLWVDLVVTSLLTGMRLGDRLDDFQRRLDELPPDLEKLYEKILHSLDPFYLEHAAQFFTLVESAEAPLTIMQFSFADEESPESAIKMRLGEMTSNEISLRIEAVNRRLNSRCKGFLEVERGLHGIKDNDIRRQSRHTVQYLHRTVRDFIKSPKAQNFLQSSTSTDFDPSIQLCVAYLMDSKAWTGLQDENGRPVSILNILPCFRKAACVTKVNEGAVIELLEELNRVTRHGDYTGIIEGHYYDPLRHDFPGREAIDIEEGHSEVSFRMWLSWTWGRYNGRVKVVDDLFLSLAVSNGVVPYVTARAKLGGLILGAAGQYGEPLPLLLVALSGEVPEPVMVECLLDIGADPNYKISNVNSQTPWMVALTKTSLLYTTPSRLNSQEYSIAEDKWKQTLRLMFSRGADCKVPESLLSPINRKILRDLREEARAQAQSSSGLKSWLSAWNLI